jgi:ATP-binding cassette, subfamily B, bacterial
LIKIPGKNITYSIVLHQGQIIEEGDHDSLMVQGGHYAELYNTYFRHQSSDYEVSDLSYCSQTA